VAIFGWSITTAGSGEARAAGESGWSPGSGGGEAAPSSSESTSSGRVAEVRGPVTVGTRTIACANADALALKKRKSDGP
jgi:hypothetical protein